MSAATSDPLSGGVALVTGANTGIGFVTARELARRGARVFIACRAPSRAEAALAQLREQAPQGQIELLTLDLADLDSVRRCADEFLSRGLSLPLLINNAGVSGVRGLTRSGFELSFGINHIGHFLLTKLLLPRIQESPAARIVTVASKAHRNARGIDFESVRRSTGSVTGLAEYAVSKLANILFSAELARRLAGSGVTTYSLHPGVVASEIWRRVPWPIRPLIKLGMLSNEQGAATSLHCALAAAAATESGLYYDECQVVSPSSIAQDRALAAELWQRSEAWVS